MCLLHFYCTIPSMEYPMRINKYISHKGIASRREADTLIEKGEVTLNGTRARIGDQVQPTDVVEVKNRHGKRQYLAYYKGRGVVTHSAGPGDIDIPTKLAADYNITNLYPVGRLDKDSEGLILLTNDGRVTGQLFDPENPHYREYEVHTDKPINNWFLKHMQNGVNIEGYTTKPATAAKHSRNPKRFSLTLTEGKKHQIRRMCAALGYQVTTLKRIRIASIELGKLKPNQYRKLVGTELADFLSQLNISN